MKYLLIFCVVVSTVYTTSSLEHKRRFKTMTATTQCTHEELFHGGFTNAFQCKTIATKVCTSDFINFYKMYWCDLDKQLWALLVITVVLIFFIFRYTAIAVDEYICSGVTIISDR